jgi:hypothetical protein
MTYYDVGQSYEEWPSSGNTLSALPCQVRLALTLRDEQRYERTFMTTVSLPMRGACEDEQTRRSQRQ